MAAYVSDCLRLIHSSVQAWQSSDMDILEHQVSYALAMPNPSLDWQAVEEHLETVVPDISSTPQSCMSASGFNEQSIGAECKKADVTQFLYSGLQGLQGWRHQGGRSPGWGTSLAMGLSPQLS